jgi:YVTN family beta-propeller protein
MRKHTKSVAPVAALFVLLAMAAAAADDPNNVTGGTGLILIDKRGNHVRFFDPKTFAPQGFFSTGPLAPHDLAISPDHRTAYIPLYGDGIYRKNPNPGRSILVVDLASQKVTDTIDVSPHQAPHGIQVDAKGTLYVVADISKTLLVIDPKARKVESAVDVEGTGHWLAILPDASKAYVANQTDVEFISVVDLKTRRMIGRIPSKGGTRGIVASPDGRRVYAMEGGEPDVLVIDTATDTVVDNVRLQGHSQSGYKLRISPDGRTIVTCGSGGGSASYINIIDTANLHGPQAVLQAGRNSMGFAFAPDGKTVLVANDGDGTVTVIDILARQVVSTFKAGVGIESLSYF